MPINPTSASLPGRCQSRDHHSRRDANRPWDTGMLACRPTGTQHGGTGSSLSRIHRFHSFPQRRPFRHHRANPPLPLTQTTLFLQALNPLPPQLSKQEMPADPQDSYRSAFGGPLHRHLRRSVAPPCVPSLPLGRGIRDLSRSRNRAGPVRPVVFRHAFNSETSHL